MFAEVCKHSCNDSFCRHKLFIIVKSCTMSGGVWGSLLLGDDSNIVLLWYRSCFCVAWEIFTDAQWRVPNVPVKHFCKISWRESGETTNVMRPGCYLIDFVVVYALIPPLILNGGFPFIPISLLKIIKRHPLKSLIKWWS